MIKVIYFDTDCISSFLWVDEERILLDLFTGKIIVPKQVYRELSNPSIPHIGAKLDRLWEDNNISVEDILFGTYEYRVYYELTENPPKGNLQIGKGEAATISLATANNGFVASNNLKDINQYICQYNLELLTTGDILIKAYNANIINDSEGDFIWGRMLEKRRWLPTQSFTEYLSLNRKN
ncbi:hypothetical protein [Natranaerobius trueperi]|uniref:PIN domain-containing protein n=1 Tax=Natranaerobius trueperi TaxID=759412 RepID=A0A226BX52_9FIRM|nr:hypothetical protein [Natranaerobius trueperi]OWZ83362.1 hypothetical protein CDO51_09080 [Natranaerobius trueperi]